MAQNPQQRPPVYEDNDVAVFEGENDSEIAASLVLIPDEVVVLVISTDADLFKRAWTMAKGIRAGKVSALMKPEEFARVIAAGGKSDSAHVIHIEAGLLKRVFRA